MFGLRALMPIGVGLLAATPAAHALPPQVSIAIQSESRNGSLDVSDLNRKFSVNRLSETITGRVDNLVGHYSLQGGVSLVHPDYSSVTIADAKGKSRLLSEQFGNTVEPSAQLGIGWDRNSHSVFTGWQGNLTGAPFSSQLARTTYVESFFEGATKVGVGAAFLNQAQPISFFTDRDFKIKSRPKQVNAYEASLNWEQLISEEWKSRLEVGISRRIEERPLGYSIAVRQAYALTNRLFIEAGLSTNNEFHNFSLQNERGYFRTYGTLLSVTLEPVFDLLVTASYGLQWERESDPRLGREIQVAADQYGLTITYPFSQFECQTQARYTATNTGIKSVGLSGSLLWKI